MAFVANPGTRIVLGGTPYVLPPLSIGQMEQLKPEELAQMSSGGMGAGKITMIGDLTFGALTRNYPNVTRDDVVKHLDLGNMMDVLGALMKMSNFTRDESEPEEKGSGEMSAIGSPSGST